MSQPGYYLPDIVRIAPPCNIRLLNGQTRPTEDTVPFNVEGKRHEDLEKAIHAWTGAQTLSQKHPEFSLEDPVDSWRELLEVTTAQVHSHIDTCDFKAYSQLREVSTRSGYERQETPKETAEETKKVAFDGIATAIALMEVAPKVVKEQRLSKPNEETAQLALNSIGLITAWARLHGDLDQPLAYAAADPRPKIQNGKVRQIFKDLHLSERWFVERRWRIVFDGRKVSELRDHKGQPLNKFKPENRELFGCAFIRYIPALSKAMIKRAAKDGLFERTYEEARAAA